jgi:hypothetical protein
LQSLSEISAKALANRSGGSAERRKLQKNEECGFLPKAAMPVLQRFPFRISFESGEQWRTRRPQPKLSR